MQTYKEILLNQLNEIDKQNSKEFNSASNLIKDCIKNQGLIYIFGCGHSGLLSQDQFFRAGGLGNIYPILHEPLMLHISASNSSILEKEKNYVEKFINNYQFSEKDLFILISTSGKNAVPIEVAKFIKNNTPTKLITISAYSYQKMFEETIAKFGDVNLNNCCEIGDAVLGDFNELSYAPTSTINSAYTLNTIISMAIDKCLKEKIAVDVFKSGNLPGCETNNQRILNKYQTKIKHL